MSKPLFVTDVDFVLLDWVVGLKPFLEEKGLPHEHIEQFRGSTYYPCLSELFLEKDENLNVMLMKEFNKSKWIEHLPIFQEEARKHLENIKQEFDIIALTCLGDDNDQIEKRRKNLINHYGDIFEEVICIPVRTSKEKWLEELKKEKHIEFYCDDRMKHLQEAINVGIKPLLYVRNAEAPNVDVTIVNCWSEIEKKLIEAHNLRNKNSVKQTNKKILKR